MNKQNPVLLFVGDRAESIREQLEPQGWLVYHPDETMEVLAMYVFYMPDLVVIEDAHPDAADVTMHLQSVGASNLLWIGDDIGEYTLPTDVDDDTLIAALRAWDSHWEVCTTPA